MNSDPTNFSAASHAHKILNIDDDQDIRQNIRELLENFGYQVTEAADGLTGLEILKTEDPDLVLCDLRMPGMHGLEVLAQITQEYPQLPVIVISGTDEISDAVKALHLGAWDFILKPIRNLSVIIHAVERALERARLLRENRRYQVHLEDEVAKRTRELAASNVRLAKAEEMLNSIIKSVPDVIYRLDQQGNYTFVSDAVKKYGYIPAELLGISVFDLIHPEDHDKASNSIIERRTGDQGVRNMEVRILVKSANGICRQTAPELAHRIFLIESHGLYTQSESGETEFIGTQGIARDITEQKKAEKEKKLLEEQLRQAQKMEDLGRLAGGIAHDFNNILGSIIGFTEMGRMSLDDENRCRENLDEALLAAERARDLIKQILTFSRRTPHEMLEINIAVVIKEALKLLRASLPSTVKIHSLIDENSGMALADSTQIHQVVMNVCTNAVHAMGEKGGIIEVKLDPVELDEDLAKRLSLETGHFLKLSIQDDGPGIDPEIMDQIFDPFFTTKPKGEGTGLGLSMVHGIMKNHGGAINVGSPPRRGTVFDIYFPRVTAVAAPKSVEKTVSKEKKNVHILLIDDEPALVKANTWMLEHLGHKVTGTTSSLEALETLKNQPDVFDLVLTDQTMPEMTGRELARKMLEIRPDLPVILCSGFSEMTAANIVDEPGIKDFLMKPISVKELDRVIQRVIGR